MSNKQFILFISILIPVIYSCTSSSSSEQGDSTTTAISSEGTGEQEEKDQKTILFFGNSITAGYGLDPSESYPAWVQKKLDSLNKNYQVVNAGLSGETTAAGVKRLDWILERQDIQVFVLELGGNDGLRGINPEETEKNLGLIIEKVKEKSEDIKILLTGIEVPPNMGEMYASKFRNVFKNVAEKYALDLMPFILKDVGGIPALNQADGIHPTIEGQKIIAENIWGYLKKMMD